MAGIYIHIPFCKQACHYCDFHFSTSLKLKADMVKAILHEIRSSTSYLSGEEIKTIYFGGGSPSILTKNELCQILNEITSSYSVNSKVEITLEANPDDLTKDMLKELKEIGINRLSIGIQSFRDEDLKLMNRAHNETMARNSIEWSLECGFNNLNLDLIYGIPALDLEDWRKNLESLFSYKPSHLSAYSLTIENKTAFGHWVKKGTLIPQKDEHVIDQFVLLMEMAKTNNYEHYEISNFCQPDRHSQHNTSYWLGEKYLGVGPSAHSFDGKGRRWNIRNNPLYIKAILNDQAYFEEEVLSEKDKFNEYVLTSLRTKWGIDTKHLTNTFDSIFNESLMAEAKTYLDNGLLQENESKLLLTEKGKLVADKITSDLFMI